MRWFLTSLSTVFTVLIHQFSAAFFKRNLLTLLMAALCLVLFFVPGSRVLLRGDNALILSGEWWRLLTSVWVHNGLDHLIWNLLTLLATGFIVEQFNRKAFAVYLALVIPSLGIFKLLYFPEQHLSLGYSSVAAGLFVLLLVWIVKYGWQTKDYLMSAVSAGLLVFYGLHELGFAGHLSGWEVLSGRSVDETPGLQRNPTHLFGMLVAFLFSLVTRPTAIKPEGEATG